MAGQAIAQVLLQEVEDAGFLWLVRRHSIGFPNLRLRDVVALDERVDAHIDALRVAGEVGWVRTCEALEQAEAGALFACSVLAIEVGKLQRFADMFIGSADADRTPPNDARSDRLRDAIGALCWSTRDAATQLTDRLKRVDDPLLRALGIAAYGSRRNDPGPALAHALSDPSPLVRARAYRTTGQLGRADLSPSFAPASPTPTPNAASGPPGPPRAWAPPSRSTPSPISPGTTSPAPTARSTSCSAASTCLQANAWLREFAKLPGRQRDLIRATGVIGDPLYIPWLIEHMADNATARLAGEAFSMITGLDLAYRDLDRRPPADFHSGPNDDPADENVALDEDENLPWPDPARIGPWWTANRARFSPGTAYFLGDAESLGRLAGGAVRCLPAPAPRRGAGTRHPPARQGDVRSTRPRPAAAAVDRPRARTGIGRPDHEWSVSKMKVPTGQVRKGHSFRSGSGGRQAPYWLAQQIAEVSAGLHRSNGQRWRWRARFDGSGPQLTWADPEHGAKRPAEAR